MPAEALWELLIEGSGDHGSNTKPRMKENGTRYHFIIGSEKKSKATRTGNNATLVTGVLSQLNCKTACCCHRSYIL